MIKIKLQQPDRLLIHIDCVYVYVFLNESKKKHQNEMCSSIFFLWNKKKTQNIDLTNQIKYKEPSLLSHLKYTQPQTWSL